MTTLNNLAADIHLKMVKDDRFGYSWSERYGVNQEMWDVDGVEIPIKVGDYDCSSSTITAWRLALGAAGVTLGNATYTGNMRSVFLATGLFEWRTDFANAKRGDLYLNEANHVAMCQGNGQLSEFSGNEYGGAYGGQRGDQTGWEAHVCGYYNYPWNGYIHYIGTIDVEGDIVTEQDKKDIARMCAEYVYGDDKKDNVNMYNATHWALNEAKAANRKLDALTEKVNGLPEKLPWRVWSYKNPKLEKVDAYQILRDVRTYAKRIEALEKKLEDLAKKMEK